MDNSEGAGGTIQMSPRAKRVATEEAALVDVVVADAKRLRELSFLSTMSVRRLKAFGKHGTVMDAYNPGKGFAFVSFSKAQAQHLLPH